MPNYSGRNMPVAYDAVISPPVAMCNNAFIHYYVVVLGWTCDGRHWRRPVCQLTFTYYGTWEVFFFHAGLLPKEVTFPLLLNLLLWHLPPLRFPVIFKRCRNYLYW